MKEIFPALLDSMYVETTFSMTPAVIIEVIDTVTGKKELQPAEKDAADKALLSNLLPATDPVIIVLSDSVHGLYEDDLAVFRSGYTLSAEAESTQYCKKNYLLPLGDLTARNCFRLTLFSQFKRPPADSIMFVRKLEVLGFSRIIFDAEKMNGMLTCEYVCGSLCGNGYRIYIEKRQEKWIIRRIEPTWVS